VRVFDQVSSSPGIYASWRESSAVAGEHLFHALPQTALSRSVIVLQLTGDLLQPLLAFFRAGKLEGRRHQPPRLILLFFGQFVHRVLDFVVAAPLHLLLAAEQFLNGRMERFGAVDHEQILAVGRQPPVAQPGEQLLDRRRVFRGPGGNPQNVLGPSGSTPAALRM
jgi:hypothetical protein